jgi:copper homeostasis protein
MGWVTPMSNERTIVELIANSPSDCLVIEQSGADRIELVSNLDHGGLTPTTACVALSRVMCQLQLCVMVRPRPGDFCYSDIEFKQALMEAEQVTLAGADAIVSGFLTADLELDLNRFRAMKSVVEDLPIVCHRCFDRTADVFQSLEKLIDAGVTRVLTSGGTMSAVEGADTLKRLVEQADGRIEILAGGGVRSHNVADLIDSTGVTQVHASANRPKATSSTGSGAFGDQLRVDADIARDFVTAVRRPKV